MTATAKKLTGETGYGVYTEINGIGAFEPLPSMSRADAQTIADEINRPERRDYAASPADHLHD